MPAAPFPTTSPSPRHDENIPRAKKRRRLVREGEVEATNQQMNHNNNKEYRHERAAAVATMAPPQARMQLSGSSGWHPSSNFPTTQFTGLSIAAQVGIRQIFNGTNGSASTAPRGTVQTTSPFWNGWSPRGSQATGLTGVPTGDQLNLFQILHGMNGYAGAATPCPDQTKSPCWNGRRPQGSGCHPSTFPTTGFTGVSVADRVDILQMLNGMNGHAGTVAPGSDQTPSSLLNGRSPRRSDWHPTIAQATGLTGALTGDQLIRLQILHGMNGYAGTAAPYPGRTTPCWNGRSSQDRARDRLIGRNGMQMADQGYASLVRGPHQATTSPWWNGLSSRDSAWNPAVAHAAGLPGAPGTQPVDQDNVIQAQQIGTHGYSSHALDPRQTTTGLCQNRLHKAVDTPVDQTTTGGSSRLKTEEVDIEHTAERKGKWTAVEDRLLLHAVEKFSVTRWQQIAKLIPGRTKKQCWNRWQYAVDPSVVGMIERTGKWSAEEDDKLVAAVQKYNGKNWDAIAALVPSRTKRQCMDRWHKVLNTSVC